MKSDDELLIERFADDAAALSADERACARKLVATDPEARALYEFFQRYYQALRSSPGTPQDRVDSLMDRLFPPPRTILLRPFVASTPGQLPHVSVLATLDATTPPRFETLATLVSEDYGILLRLLYDRDSKVCRIYVITNKPEQRNHVLVNFPGLRFDFVTDTHGRTEFKLDEEQARWDWKSAGAVIRLPLYSFALDKQQLHTAPYEAELPDDGSVNLSLTHEPPRHDTTAEPPPGDTTGEPPRQAAADEPPHHGLSGETLHLDTTRARDANLNYALLESDSVNLLIHLKDTRTHFPITDLPSHFTLRLY